MSHRTQIDWMGTKVDTLADLLRPGLRAICIGINPAPISVRAGHYYQGNLGQRVMQRLEDAGIIPTGGDVWADDWAFAHGVGFTDIVKRATNSEKEIYPAEYKFGRSDLHRKIREFQPPLVIFTFKKVAEVLFGPFQGHGFVESLSLASSRVFVMPGPYEKALVATKSLESLRGSLLE